MSQYGKRISEFVEYHNKGDGECNNDLLKAWACKHKLDIQEKYYLAFLFSVTYCVESAIILYEAQQKHGHLAKDLLKEIKPKIVFQSDRRWMSIKHRFEQCVEEFYSRNSDAERFLSDVAAGGVLDLEKGVDVVSKWRLFGRFASFLFLETFVELTGYRTINAKIEWNKGDTATSGLLNVYCYDECADHFDKTGELVISTEAMDDMAAYLLSKIRAAGGDDNITKVETSLCAYRKFHKGTRYNGYYIDRMLEEIYKLSIEYPEISQEMLELRSKVFDERLLGEKQGWRGVRKLLKSGILPREL